MTLENTKKRPLSYHFLIGEASKRFFDLSANIIGYINSFITIKYLSVFSFGIFQLLLSLFSIIDGFVIDNFDGPVAIEMRKYFSNNSPDKAKRIFKEYSFSKIFLTLIITLPVFFASNVISNWYGKEIGLLIKIASPLLIFYTLESLVVIFLKSVYSLNQWCVSVVREFIKLIIILLIIFYGELNILSLVIAHVIAQGSAVLFITIFVVAKKYSNEFKNVNSYGKYMLFDFLKGYGKWIFLGYTFSRLTKNTMPWLIKFFVSVEAVAFYSLAINMVAIVEGIMPISGIDRLFVLKMGNINELSFIFKRSIKYIFWFGVIMLIPGFFIIPWLVELIFPKYNQAIPLFKIMFLAVPIFGVYKTMKSILLVLREYGILTKRILNEVFINIFGSLFFLPIFGVFGAGLVYTITYIERTWFFYSRLIKEQPTFRIKLKEILKFDSTDFFLIKRVFNMFLYSLKLSKNEK